MCTTCTLPFHLFLLFIAARHPFPSLLEDLSREVLDDLEVEEDNSDIYSESLNTNMYPVLDVCSVEIPRSEMLEEASSGIKIIPILNFGNIHDFEQTAANILNASMGAIILGQLPSLNRNAEMQHMRPGEYILLYMTTFC